MFKPPFFGKLEFDVTMEESPGLPEPETPFRICILGDFSGRSNRGLCEPGFRLAGLRAVELDRDNFDEVLARLGVKLNLSVTGSDGPRVAIKFNELEDFHPDRILERVEAFQVLKQMRKKLNEPSAFAAAAAEVRTWAKREAAPEPRDLVKEQLTSAPKISNITAGNLLEQMLEETQSRKQEARQAPDEELQSFLREVVKPYLVPSEDPQRSELVACVDEAIGKLMRSVLHHTDFQEIEAAWRALYFLVSRLETGTELKLYLLDISKAELAADLNWSEDLRTTGIYKLLVEETVDTPGGEPWAVLIGNYSFNQTREDAELLGRIAKIARQAGAPFISAAGPHLLGCESLAETPDPDDWRPADPEGSKVWEALRQLPETSYLGLALPGFLLRLPYGPESDPVEQFDFQEMPEGSKHESYLWGNPAFACAYLLGRAFSNYGWDFRPGVFQEIEDLPMHVYQEQGESRIKPCAEVLLTQRAAETILDRGPMPLLSFKGRDTIRLARFQSLADPATPLTGRWS